MIKVRFFAQLREQLNIDGLEISEQYSTVGELRDALQRRSALWQEQLASDKTLVAVNQTIRDDNADLNVGDEVAFFPPVTGG